MKIDLHTITLARLFEGYSDDNEGGVQGYGGRLNIRPEYQREFVYKGKQKDDVIRSVIQGFPINVMYWVQASDGTFELMDGQQRTISLCSYINGDFSVDNLYFNNLSDDEQQSLLDYELMIYQCNGTDSEKINWFQVINIASEKLTNQEILNAIYRGKFVSSAKTWFSKQGGPAFAIGGREYLKGSAIRQDYLETAIKWISDNHIEKYMSEHQHDKNADELWGYFCKVIDWVKCTFPKYRKEMKGIDWGKLHAQFSDEELDANELEEIISECMGDDDVTNKKGAYEYALDGNERHLNIRNFDEKTKRSVYTQQGQKCKICNESFDIEDMEGDHIEPWSEGGATKIANCQMICKPCHKEKTRRM